MNDLNTTVSEDALDLSPNNLIDFTQKERLKLLNEDEVKSDAKLKLSVLDSVSFTALQSLKIKTDDANAAANKEVAAAIALGVLSIKGNPYELKDGINTSVAALPDIPEFKLVPGETSLELAILNYEDVDNITE